jgi:hypothetical protein
VSLGNTAEIKAFYATFCTHFYRLCVFVQYMDTRKYTVNNKQNAKHTFFLLFSKINISMFARSQPAVSAIPFKTKLSRAQSLNS